MAEALRERRADTETFRFAGHDLLPDVSGALFWPERDTLLVADLHLEKGSAFAARRTLLPPYDSAATLARLLEVMARLRPRLLVLLGDSFHDAGGPARLDPETRALFAGLSHRAEVLALAGNHDPEPLDGFAFSWRREIEIGNVLLRHEPARIAGQASIGGHLHPVAKVSTRAGLLRRRCFATDGERLVLPAFGAYAGGLNVRGEAFARLFAGAPRVFTLGERRVFEIGYGQLRPD